FTMSSNPPYVDSVVGTRLMCMYNVYQYKVLNPSPGYTYNWAFVNGNSLQPVGDSITAQWSADTCKLVVYSVSKDSSYCTGPKDTINVYQYPFNPNLLLPGYQCANSTVIDVTDGIVVDEPGTIQTWSLLPPEIGSITSGQGTNTISIQFGDVTGHGQLSVQITQCNHDTIVYDPLFIKPAPSISVLIKDLYVCSGGTERFIASSGSAQYAWNFGDGTLDTTTSDTAFHQYFGDPGDGTITLTATVIGLGIGGTGCSVSGKGTAIVNIQTGPYVSIETPNQVVYCGSVVPNDSIFSAVKGATGSPASWTYTWYNGATIVSSGTGNAFNKIVVTSTGNYYLVFSDSSGCTNFTSDTIIISNSGPCVLCPHTVTENFTAGCNGVITAKGAGGGTSPTWSTTGGGIISNPHDTLTTITYNKPGYYQIKFYELFDSCYSQVVNTDSIPLITNFYWTYSCTTPNYTVNFQDISQYLATWTLDSVVWVIKQGVTTVATGHNRLFSTALAGGTYTITETVYVHYGSKSQNCTSTNTITVPTVPTSITIDGATNSTCEGIPIQFSSTIAPAGAVGMVDYYWTFGDSSASTLANPIRTYTYVVPVPTSN
ncbi:MAG: hypothetical protein JST19_22850, partial [Bacteroidetes bacterium]|nr:hypothetical protein [Bacteroidota bacterium]